MNVGKQMRSGAAMGMVGDLLPPEVAAMAKDYFAFGVDIVPLGASGTVSKAIQVDQDGDFLLCELAGIATAVGAPQTLVSPVGVLISFLVGGSGRNLQSTAIHFENLFGSGELPHYLPYPKLLPRSSAVTITAQNLTATAMDLRLSLGGFKIFNFPDSL